MDSPAIHDALAPSIAGILIALAGLALIVQARKTAARLILLALSTLIVPQLLAALLPLLLQSWHTLPQLLREPAWMSELSLWTLPVFLVPLLLILVRLVLGRAVVDQMLGILLADLVRTLLRLPFRMLSAVLQRLRGP